MKLNTEKYKMTIFTEDGCPDCLELKNKLKKLDIPYIHKSISANSAPTNAGPDKEKAANRWEFIDLSREFPGKVGFSPTLVLENTEGEKNVFSLEGEKGFKNTEEALEILKEYCI
tara:strand:- start:31 stop:375 length:345 start_codon:yes stop_codon:yes gene_type:complete